MAAKDTIIQAERHGVESKDNNDPNESRDDYAKQWAGECEWDVDKCVGTKE